MATQIRFNATLTIDDGSGAAELPLGRIVEAILTGIPPVAEAPKAEAPKDPKAEAPKAEAPKAEAPKAEAPKAEAPKAEAPKAAKAEAPKAAKAEAPKAEEFGPPDTVTIGQVTAAITEALKNGVPRDMVKSILSGFDATKPGEIPPARYAEALDQFRALVAG